MLEGFGREMASLVLQSTDSILQLQAVRTDVTELENELFMRKVCSLNTSLFLFVLSCTTLYFIYLLI